MTEKYEGPEEFYETIDYSVEEQNLREALEREELELHKKLDQKAIEREIDEDIADRVAEMMMEDYLLAERAKK